MPKVELKLKLKLLRFIFRASNGLKRGRNIKWNGKYFQPIYILQITTRRRTNREHVEIMLNVTWNRRAGEIMQQHRGHRESGWVLINRKRSFLGNFVHDFPRGEASFSLFGLHARRMQEGNKNLCVALGLHAFNPSVREGTISFNLFIYYFGYWIYLYVRYFYDFSSTIFLNSIIKECLRINGKSF